MTIHMGSSSAQKSPQCKNCSLCTYPVIASARHAVVTLDAHSIAPGLDLLLLDPIPTATPREGSCREAAVIPRTIRVTVQEPAETATGKRPTDIILAPTMESAFACVSTTGNHAIAIVITPERLRTELNGHPLPKAIENFGKECTQIIPQSTYNLCHLIHKVKCYSCSGAAKQLYLRSIIFGFIVEILDSLHDPEAPQMPLTAEEHRLIQQARDFLLDKIARPPTINTLVKRLGTTPRKLNFAFRKVYGKSVFQCLSNWRLELGAKMLKETDMTAKAIAIRLGYTYTDNFIHAFTKRYGATPNRYRKAPQE